MQLALESLWERGGRHAVPESWGALDQARDALFMGDTTPRLARALDDEIRRIFALHLVTREGVAILRARLALYLRAVLRADAGDYGWRRSTCYECRVCGERAIAVYGPMRAWFGPSEAEHARRCGDRLLWRVKLAKHRPLYQTAPAHDGRTPRERRTR